MYFDYNSTSPMRPEVLEAMKPFLTGDYGNPSSLHHLGQIARKAVEEARATMAAIIGAGDPSEIIFTSGGTEANNLAIKGAARTRSLRQRRIVTTAIEHAAVRQPARALAEEERLDHVAVPVEPDGRVAVERATEAMTSDAFLVSVMAANNETGVVQPIAEIAAECRDREILFHTDAVQVGGKIKINVNAMGADMLSLSAHKFGGPKGVGVLYVRKGTRLSAQIHGGRQENNRRGGTENVAGIVGMAAAASIAEKELPALTSRLEQWRNDLERNVLARVPHTFVNGSAAQRLCNTSNICFPFTDSSAMVAALDLRGLCCSNGSACASGVPEASHVLLAMGLPQDKAHASLRFSIGHKTLKNEIDAAVELLVETTARQRETNPLWKEAVH